LIKNPDDIIFMNDLHLDMSVTEGEGVRWPRRQKFLDHGCHGSKLALLPSFTIISPASIFDNVRKHVIKRRLGCERHSSCRAAAYAPFSNLQSHYIPSALHRFSPMLIRLSCGRSTADLAGRWECKWHWILRLVQSSTLVVRHPKPPSIC
jgi:hypothetical protein